MKLDTKKITNIEWEDIDSNDYPDFVDAFAVAFDYGDREATEEEIEYFNEHLKYDYYDSIIQSMI